MIRILAFLRSLLAVLALFPLLTVGLSLICLVHNLFSGSTKGNDRIIGAWAGATCWMFGVDVRAYGTEHIPQGTFVLLFSHKSFFDIFAIAKILPDVRFGAKVELFRIPIFGAAMRAIGILPIARGNVENVIRVYKAAEVRTKNGERFALAPEGGRNTSEQDLLPFKSGPFLFAISANSPLLPVVVHGAADVWPKGSLIPQATRLKSAIELHFLELVPVSDLGFEKTAERKNYLQKKIYQMMDSKMQNLC